VLPRIIWPARLILVSTIPLRPGEASRVPKTDATHTLGQRASFWVAAAVVVHTLWTKESPLDELRQQFEVNVFGAVSMIKAVLPFMRQRRSGRIINVTSMGGMMTMPGLSWDCPFTMGVNSRSKGFFPLWEKRLRASGST